MLDNFLFSTNLSSLRIDEDDRRTLCNGSTSGATYIAPKQIVDKLLPICFQKKRHLFPIEGIDYEKQSWRIRERMKTVSVALVLCLNIGVDPPDIVKIDPCAKLECWIDPTTVSAPKAMELIGTNLQKQYERWQPRARYKKFHDPTVDDVKKLCTSLRRNAKEERVLFHYNGHGVPRPTTNGEIWVFNKTYTQYIPLSIYDLQAWMGAPSIYVYDCSNAGIIVNSFNQFAEQHEKEIEKNQSSNGRTGSINSQATTYKNCIQLAACSSNQILPMNSKLPADLFTSCLTTPIRTALKWYTMQAKKALVPEINTELIDKIPGQLNDRRTMLGELNWIFTAITDTIAWNTLPRDLFQKLFRQDLLVASLFRNFLLAERILRSHDCTPVSSPALPQCFRHPMWSAWDLAVDLALQQLPDILENDVAYKQLPFFEQQLTAFQVWLDRQSETRLPPEQLPIVLQVLLSQVHRLRALELLARFLDLGPWAVNLALGVGIFPYVLKLLQSSAKELRPVLVFIWAKILAVDNTCQVDLVKDHKYFHAVLQDPNISKEHRTLAAFVLSCIVNNFLLGQTSALQGSLVSICLVQLNDEFWLLRQWLVICLGKLWQNFAKARWSGVRDLAHEKLYPLLKDPVPEVRAAAVYALGTFISSVTDRSEEHANNIDRIIAITLLDTVGEDASPLVRLELVAALQWMVLLFVSQFVSVHLQEFNSTNSTSSPSSGSTNFSNISTHSLERNINMKRGYSSSSIPNMSGPTPTIPFGSIFLKLWQGIVHLGRDPYPQVAQAAQIVIEFVRNSAISLITAKEATSEKCAGVGSSLSLPPSPNTRTNYLAKTSPSTSSVINMQMNVGIQLFGMGSGYATGITSAGANDSITYPSNASRTVHQLNTTRNTSLTHSHSVGKDRSGSLNDTTDGNMFSSTESSQISHLQPLVTTKFIPWAISYFSRPSEHKNSCINDSELVIQLDKNSTEARAREWRFKRNEKIRQSAYNKQLRVGIRGIETQNWISKTPFTPSIIKFLPYEQHIAVAFKERVSVYDYRRHIVHCYTPTLVKSSSVISNRKTLPSNTSNSSRVTALEFINAHDIGMYAVGYEDGMVRIWQEPSDPNVKESRLVTAWEALPIIKHNRDTTNFVTTWHQKSCHLIVGGYTRNMSIWDVEKELKVSDIPTGADVNIKLLSSSLNELIAAGYYDGSVRLFDKRLSPADAKIRTYRDDNSAILTACLRDNCSSLITGCSNGTIRIFDIRAQSSINSWNIGNEVIAIAIHQSSNIVACGNQYVSIYGLNGKPQATIRSHDSFMGPKVGQTSCLALHPHKVVLGSGYVDNTIAVYGHIDSSKI